MTATHNGNDVAYMYGTFKRKTDAVGREYLRNTTHMKNPDLGHSIYEQTDFYWMDINGNWVGGGEQQSRRFQTAGWHVQADRSRRRYNAWAYGDMETAVLQDLRFRPDPSSPVETSKDFWF